MPLHSSIRCCSSCPTPGATDRGWLRAAGGPSRRGAAASPSERKEKKKEGGARVEREGDVAAAGTQLQRDDRAERQTAGRLAAQTDLRISSRHAEEEQRREERGNTWTAQTEGERS